MKPNHEGASQKRHTSHIEPTSTSPESNPPIGGAQHLASSQSCSFYAQNLENPEFASNVHTIEKIRPPTYPPGVMTSPSTTYSPQGHATAPSTDLNFQNIRGWAPIMTLCNFPYELGTMACNKQATFSMRTSDEDCPDSVHTVDRLYTAGYLHWNDSFAAESLNIFQGLNFAQGLGILRSILANAQLRDLLRKWFAPSEGPYIIGHCFYYSDDGTGRLPIFFRHNNGQRDRCVDLHLLTADISVRYFVGSHKMDWAPTKEKLVFKNSYSALDNYQSEQISNGL